MDERPTFGSLFAGIGGIDLGLERAGWRGRWQVEYEPFCQRVLAKHWPDVTRYGDIHDVEWESVEPVDLVAGGFPCQPVSGAGKRQAQADERWLWPEFLRCIRTLRPRYVLVENVTNLLAINDGSAFSEVLSGLAESGYDAEWDCIPAAALGAVHERDRVWIVAYPERDGIQGRALDAAAWEAQPRAEQLPGLLLLGLRDEVSAARVWRDRHGVPSRMDVARNRAIGNAVYPAVPEFIGRRILEAEALT